MSHKAKLSTLKAKKLCSNCLSSGHFLKQCTSIHKCKVCQKPHHTLLHLDQMSILSTPAAVTAPAVHPQNATSQKGTPVNPTPHNVYCNSQSSNFSHDIFSATAVGMKHNLLMTYHVRMKSLIPVPRFCQKIDIHGASCTIGYLFCHYSKHETQFTHDLSCMREIP